MCQGMFQFGNAYDKWKNTTSNLQRWEDVNARDITLAIRRGWLQIIKSHEDVLLGAPGALVRVYSYISKTEHYCFCNFTNRLIQWHHSHHISSQWVSIHDTPYSMHIQVVSSCY